MEAVPETAEWTRHVTTNGTGTAVWYITFEEKRRDDGPRNSMYGGCHRLDGPAHEVNGENVWYVNGKQVSESEFFAAVAAYCTAHPHCPSVAHYMAGRFKKPARSA